MAQPIPAAGAMSPARAILGSMTPTELARGRYMRAPDGHDDPIARIAAAIGDEPAPGADDDNSADDEVLTGAPGEDETEQPEGDQPDGEQEATDEDGEQGDEKPAAIDPPVSWNAEDKALFAQLPPEAQAVIARRESERDKAVQSKATEAAEARRQVQQAEAAIQQLNTHYTTSLEQFLASELPQAPDPAWLDVDTYGEDGPKAFYQQQAIYQAAIAQRQQAQQELEQTRRQQEALTAQQRQQFLIEQNAILSDPDSGIPGWADPTEGPKIKAAIVDFASAHGFAEQLSEADARELKFLHDARGWKDKADKYDALQKQKMSVVRAAKDLPKTVKPNAAQPSGSAQQRVTQQQRERLRSTGDVRDAAALILQRL